MTRKVITVYVSLFLALAACHHHEEGHDHSDSHPTGHDHHADRHGHGDTPVVGVTLWSEHFELFAEHSVAVVKKEASFLIHLTTLNDFRALNKGAVTLEFEGPASLRGQAKAPIRPGIYDITLQPSVPGDYRGRLVIDGDVKGTIEGFDFKVFESDSAAAGAGSDEDDHGVIQFLKEQQWGVPFGTAFTKPGLIVESIEVSGRVDAPPGGDAEVGAPITGRLVAPTGGFPRPGSDIRKGQVLALLVPAPSSPEESARANLAVAEADARAAGARVALQRAQRLIRDQAISMRELEEARREAKVAEEAVRAARRGASLSLGTVGASASGGGGWKLTAPIGGILTAVTAKPGATVAPGTALFRIVNFSELWLRVQIPEQDAAKLRTDRNASFRVAGQEQWLPITIAGSDAPAALISVGRTVDPISRTVEVIYSLKAPSSSLRVGGLIQVSLPVGEDFEGVVIARDALIDQEGRSVVYVQVDGEHFAEKLVRVGPRSGSRVAITSGLSEGERIVVKGAHLIRLADRAKGGQAHGHIH